MVGDRQQPPDEPGNLSQARADFLEGLEQRVGSLRISVERLRSQPASTQGRAQILRRVHALAVSAKVLGFAAMAEQIAKIERSLTEETTDFADSEFDRILSTLDVLPGFASTAARRSLRVPGSRSDPGLAFERLPPASSEPRGAEAPISVVLIGDEDLERVLVAGASGSGLEIERVPGDESAFERIQTAMPDVIVADSALVDSRAMLRLLRTDPLLKALPFVTVRPEGAREDSEPRGVASTLARPVRGPELWLAVQRAAQSILEEVHSGVFRGEMSVDSLVEHLVQELRRGLALQQTGEEPARVALEHGSEVLAPLWGALARIRRTISTAATGDVSFAWTGPEGGVALAPPSRAEELQGARQHADGVSLRGRRALVVDDDAEVVHFVSGLLVSAGAEVNQANDGQSALELALATWPDIVVSDILMPGLDGLELCREMKRDIVLRDTPVVLLSWKEDLLLRLRELRSEADGYLRKEAGASSVLRTISELLAPRAHVAARLAAGGEVRGRLDGLTPRLILELAIALRPNSRVSLRDAAYLYEVEIREGAPRRLTRTASDGGFERGERVVSGLLGIGAGRFAVAHNDSPCRDDLRASLRQMLERPIQRARAALSATRAERLPDIERVVVEFEAIERYLPAMPRRASALLQQIAEGASPRALLRSGALPEGLLSNVLSDLARRGAVSAVLVAGGEDLLDASGALPGAVDGQPPPPGPPMFSFQLSPAPPAIEVVVDERRQVAAKVLPTPRLGAEGRKAAGEPPAASIPPATTEVDAGWSSSRPPGGGAEPSALLPTAPPSSIDLSITAEGASGDGVGGVSSHRDAGAVDGTSGRAAGRRVADASRHAVSVRLPELSWPRARERADDEGDVPTRVALPKRSTPGEGESSGVSKPEPTVDLANGEGESSGVSKPEPTVDLADAVVRAVASPTPEVPPVTAAPGTAGSRQVAGTARARTSSIPPRTSLTPKPQIRKAAPIPSSLAEAAAEHAQSPARASPPDAVGAGHSSSDASAQRSRGDGHRGGGAGLPGESSAAADSDQVHSAALQMRGPLRPDDADRIERETVSKVAIAAIPLVKTIKRKAFAVREEIEAPPGQVRHRDVQAAPLRAMMARTVQIGAPDDGSAASESRNARISDNSPPAASTELATHDGSASAADEPVRAVGSAAEVRLGDVSRVRRDATRAEGTESVEAKAPLEEESPPPPPPPPPSSSDAPPDSEGEQGSAASDRYFEPHDCDPGPDDPAGETPRIPLLSSGSWVKSVGAMVGAAGIAFGLVWWLGPRFEKPKPDVELASPSHALGSDESTKPQAPIAEAPAIVPEELPLPDGYTLPSGKALLEIDTGGSHIIYVDGEFIGRGPLRYVTLDPGAHEVKTKLDQAERDDAVNVRAGIRVRLPLADAWRK